MFKYFLAKFNCSHTFEAGITDTRPLSVEVSYIPLTCGESRILRKRGAVFLAALGDCKIWQKMGGVANPPLFEFHIRLVK